MTHPMACSDACAQRSGCLGCLPALPQPSLAARGLRCGWNGGHCVLGNATGPAFPAQGPTWRWSDSPHIGEPRFLARACAEYRPCRTAATRCAECVAAFASPAEDCFFCPDGRVPVGIEGEGGGRCQSPAEPCAAAPVLWSNASLSCPPMPQPAAVPAPPPDRSRPLSVLLYGSLCLLFVLMVAAVFKLSE